ncbi:MAG: tRNA (uridine(54)-C5)-methyltransferase TrmA [Epsilonproteobacteria bacterium]|nr:MAG: tRNA (uridine(54)-C5)-methyltransferase TrmA [Campylobacterota bacterium]
MQNNCSYIETCGGCSLGLLDSSTLLKLKLKKAKQRLEKYDIKEFDIFETSKPSFRSRSEFRVFHKKTDIKYAMTNTEKKLFTIDSCVIVDERTGEIMPKLLKHIKTDDILSKKLFSIEFLNSTQNDTIAVLKYHKKLCDIWQTKANKLQDILNINIIGRSKKQKLVLKNDTIQNQFLVKNNIYKYNYQDITFSQPNHEINQKMINFINKNIKAGGDMCELYCGAGNFSIALSNKFEKILSTEINKTSIKLSRQNAFINGTSNIKFLRLSSDEFAQAINKTREFRRLKEQNININDYNFSTILVDPPRAGVENKTLDILKKFEQIIYISCCIDTLSKNLQTITKTHRIKKMAFFDQFMWSSHIETITILQKY